MKASPLDTRFQVIGDDRTICERSASPICRTQHVSHTPHALAGVTDAQSLPCPAEAGVDQMAFTESNKPGVGLSPTRSKDLAFDGAYRERRFSPITNWELS